MSAYDHWLTTTPEDEADAAAERRARREADHPPSYPPSRPQRAFAAYRWCPIRKCAVPDTVGVLVYREDFVR